MIQASKTLEFPINLTIDEYHYSVHINYTGLYHTVIQGFSTIFHGLWPKEVQKYMLEGQMNTTFGAIPIYFYVFQGWSEGQTILAGGQDLARRLPIASLWDLRF